MELALRTKEGIYQLEKQERKTGSLKTEDLVSDLNQDMVYSKDGKKLIVSGSNRVEVIEDRKVRGKVEWEGTVMDSELSEGGKYLKVMLRVSKDNYQLILLDIEQDLKQVERWSYQRYIRESWPLIRFNQDDSTAVRIGEGNQSLDIIKVHNQFQVVHQLKHLVDHFTLVDYMHSIYLVLGLESHDVGFKQTQGMLSIYQLQTNQQMKELLNQPLQQAQQIVVKCSQDKSVLLIKTQVHVDDTNQSYYGQNQLFHWSFKHLQLKEIKLYEGPVHSFEFVNEDKIMVISGFMPSFTVVYSKFGQPLYELYRNHRNTVVKGKNSNYVIVGGFGNLNGMVDIWDIQTMKQIGSTRSSSATFCQWSPCNNFFMTAILNPRLRVDNKYSIFTRTGQLVHTLDMSHTEMYQVLYQPKLVFTLENIEKNNNITNQNKQINILDQCDNQEQDLQVNNGAKQQKFFRPKGTSNFAAQLKAENQKNHGAKKINDMTEYLRSIEEHRSKKQESGQEGQLEVKPPVTFTIGNKVGQVIKKEEKVKQQVVQQQAIPGLPQPDQKQKKKRVRKKKEEGVEQEQQQK